MINEIQIKGNDIFPGNKLPVVLYKGILSIPVLFPGIHVKNIFERNNWTNSWDSGIFTYHHYHSTTHEVLGIYSGSATIQLGGDEGPKLLLEKGDVLVIPAGVAHKNLDEEDAVGVIGAYPNGRDYDMNYGKPGERPQTDENIAALPIPDTDPLEGATGDLPKIWQRNNESTQDNNDLRKIYSASAGNPGADDYIDSE
ncbi:MAG TPA: hypothetical protein VIM89_09385 [Mucilaginibacter sp.]